MAKIHEEILVIKFSRLVKDHEQPASILAQDVKESLAAVAEELAGSGVIVEIEQA